jgi:hypothetical protein
MHVEAGPYDKRLAASTGAIVESDQWVSLKPKSLAEQSVGQGIAGLLSSCGGRVEEIERPRGQAEGSLGGLTSAITHVLRYITIDHQLATVERRGRGSANPGKAQNGPVQMSTVT